MEMLITIGVIVKDCKTKIKYRVISIVEEELTLCKMECKSLELMNYNLSTILTMISIGEMTIEKDDYEVVDIDSLSETAKINYERKRNMMNEVVKLYFPSFIDLGSKKQKPELKAIMNKYQCPKSTFWRVCTTYFQSGMRTSALIDKKTLGLNKGKKYNYKSKPGKRGEFVGTSQIFLDEKIIALFEEALCDFKSGRHKTLKSAFTKMSMLHFSKTEIVNGVPAIVLLPQSERPTMGQFYYYAEKHISMEEKDRIKTSAMEQRNNKRLLLSDVLDGVYGPGDMVEIDACEADVSLVSTFDSNKTVGRPIVYFMVDVYTRIILAVSVAFDNNSVLGVTNLFLNLADDKKEYCARYGMGFDNETLWPSNIIPRRIRVDRGSEFKSKEFNRICNELGIEKQIVPGGSGSLKGVVEQAFHQMHVKQNVHLENYGLIEKRHDSNHHKEATLNIEQYTKMVINFVLTHNQQYFETYPLTRDMMEKRIKPIPALLWQYGVKKYGQPRPIASKEQYLYNLMTPINAKVSRKGIAYKDLWYLAENDPQLSREMFDAGNKKVPFEARMDMRNVGNIYYIRNGKLMKAPLNTRRTGNADYANLTMKQWDDIRKIKSQMNAEGRIHNEEVEAFNYLVNASLVDEAKKNSYSDNKNMRPARELEKQLVSSEERIAQRLSLTEEVEIIDETTIEEKPKIKEYETWEEALEDFWDNY